ncbi:MAG: sigma-70 family RNA polymerase sigma factor [Acidobacteriota bacterium]|nr:sigma-70 family RNA polymerase sigma factor [Acidobacteriota bacterium]
MASISSDLLQGLKARQPWAMEHLYREHQSRLKARIRSLIHDAGMAEDLVQEVFFRAWEYADAFDESRGSVAGWLLRVAHNIAIDYRRSEQYRAFRAESVDVDPAVSAVVLEPEAILLEAAVQRLRPDQRAIIELGYWEGLSHAEIAVRFRCPLGSVKTWMREALQDLRQLLKASDAVVPSKAESKIAEGIRIHAKKASLLLHGVIEHSPEAVLLADSQARSILWNRAAEQLFGGAMFGDAPSPQEQQGLYQEDGITPYPEASLPLQRAIRGEHVADAVVLLKNANYPAGVILTVTAKPRLDTGERLRGGLLFCRRVRWDGVEKRGTQSASSYYVRLPDREGAVSVRSSGIADQSRLEDVLVTDLPSVRPGRTRDGAREAAALRELTAQMATDPAGLLQCLTDFAVELCQAGSAGVSLTETTADGQEVFRWAVLSGAFASYVGGTTPRSWSPCGVSLDRGEPTLFRYPGRFFTYFQEAQPEIVEGLVIPFTDGQNVLGTIWIVSHDEQRRFDAEDVRLMGIPGNFAAAAVAFDATRQRAEATSRASV